VIRFTTLMVLGLFSLLTLYACVKQLPEPGLERTELALSPLPRSSYGHIDWVAAMRDGVISPKDSLEGDAAPAATIKLDIVFRINKALTFPDVLFPHEPHTMWLDCKNCHPSPFIMRQGGNPVSMDQIVKGEFCGRCHGVVAFPIQDCFRCHSRQKTPPPAQTKTK
jgi:c(7)-type cytochrome triheme protein